jgi:hypothetical protein
MLYDDNDYDGCLLAESFDKIDAKKGRLISEISKTATIWMSSLFVECKQEQ